MADQDVPVAAEPPPPSLSELRRRFGAAMPDEEFLLRAVMPADQVDAMLAEALAMTEVTVAEGIDAAIARFHAAEPGSRARERRERRDGPREDGLDEADDQPGPS